MVALLLDAALLAIVGTACILLPIWLPLAQRLCSRDTTPKLTSSGSTFGAGESSMSHKSAFARAWWKMRTPIGWFVRWRMVGSILTPGTRFHWFPPLNWSKPLYYLSQH